MSRHACEVEEARVPCMRVERADGRVIEIFDLAYGQPGSVQQMIQRLERKENGSTRM